MILALFSFSLFLSAFLLFLVQPMFARMVLPVLGGSPAVWTTCMVFFQACLLTGYLYAHLVSSIRSLKLQLALHAALLIAAAATLPVALPAGWKPAASSYPQWSVLALSAAAVGFPFFIVSTSAPLLQKWYSRGEGKDPYFLYAASNAGSFLALLLYPFAVEPLLSLGDQSKLWSALYATFVLAILTCGAVALKSEHKVWEVRIPGETLTAGRRARWVFWSFLPSSLLLGLTTYITTDLAPIPLFWVLPLALYLLTFIIAFGSNSFLPAGASKTVLALLSVLLFLSLAGRFELSLAAMLGLHLAVFFLASRLLHGFLAEDRPSASRLTEFYLWLSFGGVLGGLFNSLVAPLLFKQAVEYPLVLTAACAVIFVPSGTRLRFLDVLPAFVMAAVLASLPLMGVTDGAVAIKIYAVFAVLALLGRRKPVLFCLILAVMAAGSLFIRVPGYRLITVDRSFFGVSVVDAKKENGVNYHLLSHGTTLHGVQSQDPAKRRQALAYFHESGPVGDIFGSLRSRVAGLDVAVIGLGAGTLATYAREGDRWTFFEIDPVVEKIASDPAYFTFLSDSPAPTVVVLGDGRLTLKESPDENFDVIFLDAFSSDSVPVHLLTREAIRLYLAKLKPGGLLVFQVSNRYLRLYRALGSVAEDMGLDWREKYFSPVKKMDWVSASEWVVLARDARDLGALAGDETWSKQPLPKSFRVWTDDYSNLVSVL